MAKYYHGKACKHCGTTKKETGTRDCVQCKVNAKEALKEKVRKQSRTQPKLIWGKKLERFVNDIPLMTHEQLGKKYGISAASASRYVNCHLDGKLIYHRDDITKPIAAGDLVALHAGKVEYRPWC